MGRDVERQCGSLMVRGVVMGVRKRVRKVEGLFRALVDPDMTQNERVGGPVAGLPYVDSLERFRDFRFQSVVPARVQYSIPNPNVKLPYEVGEVWCRVARPDTTCSCWVPPLDEAGVRQCHLPPAF